MQYELIPLGTKVLLKRVELEVSEEDKEKPTFVFEQAADKSDLEYFKVVQVGKQVNYTFHVGDIVTVETYNPIGCFDGEQMFITDEKFVSCRIMPKNEITPRKWENNDRY